MASTNVPREQRQSAGVDRFEALRRARLASEAIDKGLPVPVEARLPSRGGAPIEPVQSRTASAPAPTKQAGMVYSQEGRPPAHVVKAAASPAATLSAKMRVTAPGSAFERLKMGQQRLGRVLERPSQQQAASDAVKGGQERMAQATIKALDTRVLSDIERQSRMAHVVGLLDVVSRYYKSAPQEIQAETQRLHALSADDLDAATRSYELCAHQVRVMTDPEHARKAARESSRELRQFFEQWGTTQMQLDSERVPEVASKPSKARRKKQ